jgi:hypothetical protein
MEWNVLGSVLGLQLRLSPWPRIADRLLGAPTLCLIPFLGRGVCSQRRAIRDSSVGIATRYGLDGPGIESRWGGGKIFRTRPDRPWGPTRPPIQRVPGTFPGVKAAEAWR